jgi:hypothetical protein
MAATAPHQRLRHLREHLGAGAHHHSCAAASLSDASDVLASLLPLPLLGHRALDPESGWLRPDLGGVRSATNAAAGSGDFRLAALLSDLAFVAEPRRPLSVADCAPPGPAEAAGFFRENGFVVVEQVTAIGG